jgi:hypothetical protein
MGAPSVSLKLIVEKVGSSVRQVLLSDSALFIVPSLATTLASGVLFSLLNGLSDSELNATAVIIMSSVILSLVGTAGIQFAIYKKVDESTPAGYRASADKDMGTIVIPGVVMGILFSIVTSGIAYPYFRQVLNFSMLQFLYFAILLGLYSTIWVLTAAFWASGKYRYPALIFTISYCAVFLLSYLAYHLSPEYTLLGFIAGIETLLALLILCSWNAFGIGKEPIKLRKSLPTIPKSMAREYWGVLFQTFFILAVFLDKIIVWVSDGTKAGNGLQILGPYTTGAFLALLPTLSGCTLAYFTNKVKPLSRDFYAGTLNEIRGRIEQYKHFYRKGLLSMTTAGFLILVLVLVFSMYFVDDPKIPMVVLTIGTGALFFEVILYNSIVLPIFGKGHISAISVMVACFGEALAAVFVSNDVWYASLGFLVGSFTGFLISHYSTTRQLSEFDYNAFRAFQTAS